MGQTTSTQTPSEIDINVIGYQRYYGKHYYELVTNDKERFTLTDDVSDEINQYIDETSKEGLAITIRFKTLDDGTKEITHIVASKRLDTSAQKITDKRYEHPLNVDYSKTEGFTKEEEGELAKMAEKYKSYTPSRLNISTKTIKDELAKNALIKSFDNIASCMSVGSSLTVDQITANMLSLVDAIQNVDLSMCHNTITHEYTMLKRICEVTTKENVSKWPLETTLDIVCITMGLLCDLTDPVYWTTVKTNTK